MPVRRDFECVAPVHGQDLFSAYLVLAEKLGAALVTRDGRLASASGHDEAIELF